MCLATAVALCPALVVYDGKQINALIRAELVEYYERVQMEEATATTQGSVATGDHGLVPVQMGAQQGPKVRRLCFPASSCCLILSHRS
jgi:hypothetical protein